MNYETLTHLSTAEPEINGTSLITYLVSANTDLWLVQRYLKQEQSTAKNIKNKQVRAGVVKALSDIIQNMPVGNSGSNGMVILAGRIKSYI